ncbi:MAG: abortive infection family protein [bacterium]|nr:abortive infection family protein [bacterium]MDE0600404.1 abortive infection family protein [bacterium]
MKPAFLLPHEERHRNLAAAGLKPNAPPNLVRLALSRCAFDTMTDTKWRELAELTSEEASVWVNRHRRFLRSLKWGDDDYRGYVFEFFRRFMGEGLQNLDVQVKFLGLSAWLEANDPGLHADLYEGTSVDVLPEVDLANLPDSGAIRDNLGRLQSQLEGGDAAATIGTAKDLIESTAKVILVAEGHRPEGEDLPYLIKRAHEIVNLHAKSATHRDPKVEAAVKRIRGGLQSVALGVVELRNQAGTGHGRAAIIPTGLDDARLAAEAAAAWIRSILTAYSRFTNKSI